MSATEQCTPIEIAIADDHQLVREAVVAVLDARPGLSIVCAAESGEQLLHSLHSGHHADVCVVDATMPGMGGPETIRELTNGPDRVPCLAVVDTLCPALAANLLRCGATGIISKERSVDDLVEAISTTAAGGRWLDPDVNERELVDDAGHDMLDELSPREFEVMMRLAHGERINCIASDLFLSPKTVSTHRRRLLDKLGLSSNVELGLYALQHGLVD
jgi:DNA-binding NarL/FixJ family response regulator